MERKWKLAFLAGLGYAQWPEGDVIASLKEIGYEGVEWTPAHFHPGRPLPDLRQLVQRTRDAGLEVSRVTTDVDLVVADDGERQRRIDHVLRVIELAGAVGVSTVGTFTGPAPWDSAAPQVGVDISEGAAWDMVFEAFFSFTAAAREAGVTITSEGVFGMLAHDFYSHRFLMDRLDTEVQLVNLDPSHGILCDNLDVGWVVRQWGSRIGHVHLKDAVGVPRMGRFAFPLLGEGNVDWTAFFTALDDISYRGFCSVEFESFNFYQTVLGGDPEIAARMSHQQVNALMP